MKHPYLNALVAAAVVILFLAFALHRETEYVKLSPTVVISYTTNDVVVWRIVCTNSFVMNKDKQGSSLKVDFYYGNNRSISQ